MKKIVCLMLAVLMISFCFAGCKGDKSEAEKTVTSEIEESSAVASGGEVADSALSETEDVAGSAQDDEIVEETEWARLYTDFIMSNKDNPKINGIYYIGINDFDFNGIPELIIADRAVSAAHAYSVYQITDGQVEHVAGLGAIGEDTYSEYSFGDDISKGLYSNFENEWITLCKNQETGEFRYIIRSGNGHSEGSFGSIVSIYADLENEGRLKLTQELAYEEDIHVPDNSKYYEGLSEITKSEYDTKLAQFNELWQNTGVVNKAMGNIDYANRVEMNLTEEALLALFASYTPETEFLN